ncbi:hypothetical protein Sipo8835_37285 [Streptomyces ipomoeae]|uniref:Uncharacterized protein n=1 Tax=Streptomyces ipomoeae TaxID=103232 RepID=A0AAE8VVF3_9ACTN|nr:hypothetical protein [Streptomyces ipomoeae]TQE21608.1 hypothetical protein Sipo8835_37285 [Streptomyces ipomoeae]
MGATLFFEVAPGRTAVKAFANAYVEARYEHGRRPYSGTIAEKDDVLVIEEAGRMSEAQAREFARQLIDSGDSRIRSKAAPAGAIPLVDRDEPTWLLFGVAAS